MFKEEKKQRLIEALEQERNKFSQRGQNTAEHDVAIGYLKYGSVDENPDDWEMLDAAINDFDCLYNDYCS